MAKSGSEMLAGRPDAEYLRFTRPKLLEIANSLGLTRGISNANKQNILHALKTHVRDTRPQITERRIRTAFGISAPSRRPRMRALPPPSGVRPATPPSLVPEVNPGPPAQPLAPPSGQVPGVGPGPQPPQAPPPGQAPPPAQQIELPVLRIEQPRAKFAEPNSTDIQGIVGGILRNLERNDPELIPPHNHGLGIDPEADDPRYKIPSEVGITVSNVEEFIAALAIAHPIGPGPEVSFVQMTTAGSPAKYIFADGPSTYPFRGRGPVWKSNSCALDTVIVAAMFLDAGSTTADKGTATRRAWLDSLTVEQRTFLDTINFDWRSMSIEKSIELRDNYLDMFIRASNSARSAGSTARKLKKGMFMAAVAVWELSTKNFHQFTFLTKRFLNVCKSCGARTEPPKEDAPESCVTIELKKEEHKQNPPPTFERLLRNYFGYTSLRDCSKCKAQGTRFRRRLIVGELPPRLVVQPHPEYRHMPGYATDDVSFNYEDPEGIERSARYRWLGGIYLCNNHYRTYWNDSKVGERPRLLRMYDGQHPGGVIIGGIRRDPDAKDEDQGSISGRWEKGTDLLFYERTDHPWVEKVSAVVRKFADELNKKAGDDKPDENDDNDGVPGDGGHGPPGDGGDGPPGDGGHRPPGDGGDGNDGKQGNNPTRGGIEIMVID